MKITVRASNWDELELSIKDETDLNWMKDVFKTILTFLTYSQPFDFLSSDDE